MRKHAMLYVYANRNTLSITKQKLPPTSVKRINLAALSALPFFPPRGKERKSRTFHAE